MECLNPEASADACNISEMIGYLGIILAGVFVCSCCLSGCCFYCRWKMKKPDVGAITLKSSKTGQSQDVRFHVFERKGTAESQVGKEKSIKTIASAFSGPPKKTVVSWELDTQNASARSLVSTGKVMLTTVGEAKSGYRRADSTPVGNAPSATSSPNRKKKKDKAKEVKPSNWRSHIEGLKKILGSGAGMHKEAYLLNEAVECFSPSNRIWTSAVIVSSGAFGADGLPCYTVRVGRQKRHGVPMKFLRKVLQKGEFVSFFTGLETSWQDAMVTSPPSSSMFGYELDLPDENGRPSASVAGRLRRRFKASQTVQIYQGAFLGWAEATVLEDALENADEIPGQKLADTERVGVSEGLSPEVQVKCHLRCDDAEDIEILEIASGCVRYTGEISTV